VRSIRVVGQVGQREQRLREGRERRRGVGESFSRSPDPTDYRPSAFGVGVCASVRSSRCAVWSRGFQGRWSRVSRSASMARGGLRG